MKGRVGTIFLGIALAISVAIFFSSYATGYRLPGNHEGYEPVQPIAFSHRLHAGELAVSCIHCHSGAESSRHAGIPAAGTCMNCHKFITAPFVEVKAENDLAAKENREPRRIVSPELRKLYDAIGLDEERTPDPVRALQPIRWVKVHNVPDFVSFNHSAHVNAGVECRTCHGQVETMERVRQVSDLSMGMCVNCHREATLNGVKGKAMEASTNCVVCHY